MGLGTGIYKDFRAPQAAGKAVSVTATPALLNTLLGAGVIIPALARGVLLVNMSDSARAFWSYDDTPANITVMAPIGPLAAIRLPYPKVDLDKLYVAGEGAQSLYVLFEG